MNKLISVIMPVKNGEKYLKEAIQGIQKQNMNVEIIVVNDGSTDNTEKIAKEMGCVVINHEKSAGQVVAKNTGIRQAHGEYIMFHDGDDVMNDNVLTVLYETLESDKETSAVMAKVKDFLSPDIKNPTQESVKPEAYYGLFTGAVLMRRGVFDKIGLFNECVHTGEIIEWNNKMADNHLNVKKIDLIATNRRIHDSNFGKINRTTEFQNYAQILREKLKHTTNIKIKPV